MSITSKEIEFACIKFVTVMKKKITADILNHILGLTFVLLMNRTPQWKI